VKEQIWDVAVIGGGPAGMMAAGRAAEGGARVVLIEKNDSLGKKLLITGGGRCNVTNAEFDNRRLLERFKDDGKYLHSAFSLWSVKETIDFFHLREMITKVENEKRVFPISDSAESVWNVLVSYIKQNGVTVVSNSPVAGLILQKENGVQSVKGVVLKNRKEIYAHAVIVATGGTSRPETGSTGDGYAWLREAGHTVIVPAPSLVPVAVKNEWIRNLAGVSLPDVKIRLFQNGVKQETKRGKILFTHFGMSGPTILNMSKDIGELLKYGDVVVSLDVLPSFDHGEVNLLLQTLFKKNTNKKFKNTLSSLVPSALASVIITLSSIDPDVECNSVTKEERIRLGTLLKDLPLNVDRLLGEEKAIITSGGVVLDEVDFLTMQSRLCSNLYLVGDILNIDRPSGGYSLQLCWTTGAVAGNALGQPTSRA
jgi:predicted Rossmann fold flavoprotein